ncbi:MAG: chemotaxis-specific protein-glutamate methyltransferase CheB [Lachnospiraceae bacterium]|nr:chemotaxis-specific protein-glutamate methyltransferase CheB [Lachnospiraceae bacterium]
MTGSNVKKILLVDDSALMRRVLCDIIESTGEFKVEDKASDGVFALDYLQKKQYDAMVLDINMPRMGGLELMKELNRRKMRVKILVSSTDTVEGAKVTMDALELGALDFIHKPENQNEYRDKHFINRFVSLLRTVVESSPQIPGGPVTRPASTDVVGRAPSARPGRRLVALASSTGGPKALQRVIPLLPANMDAPMLVVQHMPEGFTASLAERLNGLSQVTVSEAVEGERLEKGHVYISRGGKHMNVVTTGTSVKIRYTDEPPREGVKPCANYMYESLCNAPYDEICCVVMTGMGMDGTRGIGKLRREKKLHVIAQSQSTCAVYGMPKSIVTNGYSDKIADLDDIAKEIVLNVGVRA